MTRLRRPFRRLAALAAVYALLLHTMVAGLAGGALASPYQLDAFGNVICSSHIGEGAPTDPGQPANHSHLPDCCLAGCPAVGGHAAIAVPIAFPLVVVLVRPLVLELQHSGIGRGVERSPLNPRAPPSLA